MELSKMILFSCQMEKPDFPEWLNNQLNKLGWTQADLAKKSKITSAQISRLLSGTREPGPDVCNALARAFNLPPEEVFREAGLLPPKIGLDSSLEEANHKLAQLPVWQRRIVISIIDTLLREDQLQSPSSQASTEQE